MTRQLIYDRKNILGEVNSNFVRASFEFLLSVNNNTPRILVLVGPPAYRKGTAITAVSRILDAMGREYLMGLSTPKIIQQYEILLVNELGQLYQMGGVREHIEARKNLYMLAASTPGVILDLQLDSLYEIVEVC